MGDVWGTLKSKLGPLPVWGWTLLGTIALALFLIRQKNKSGDTSQAAADQTNSNLGSAAELANMFEVAGLMPYQGGDVYINTTTTQNPPPSKTTPTPPTTKPPTTTPPTTKPPTSKLPTPGTKKPSGPPKPVATYRVKKGDTLSSIAKKYGFTWQQLYKYNTTSGVRPASTIATLKARGPNKLFSNEAILIPPKGYK